MYTNLWDPELFASQVFMLYKFLNYKNQLAKYKSRATHSYAKGNDVL